MLYLTKYIYCNTTQVEFSEELEWLRSFRILHMYDVLGYNGTSRRI